MLRFRKQRRCDPTSAHRHPDEHDGDTLQSVSTPGLFPAGEGAGYAGGILSSAIDGIRVAEAVARDLLG